MNKISKFKVGLVALITVILFFCLFLFGRNQYFWYFLSISIIIPLYLVFKWDKVFFKLILKDLQESPFKKILIGLSSAGILYFVFLAGKYLSEILFMTADKKVIEIYGLKGSFSIFKIFLVMLFVVGPGEELLWRCFLQGNWSKSNYFKGVSLSLFLYIFVHIATLNYMLILAATFCGLFWSLIYLKFKSPLINMVSHTVWDIAVFLIFPFY